MEQVWGLAKAPKKTSHRQRKAPILPRFKMFHSHVCFHRNWIGGHERVAPSGHFGPFLAPAKPNRANLSIRVATNWSPQGVWGLNPVGAMDMHRCLPMRFGACSDRRPQDVELWVVVVACLLLEVAAVGFISLCRRVGNAAQ